MALPPETRLHPGHREATTVGDEWESNPFIRIWRGVDPEGDEPCTVRGEQATLSCGAPTTTARTRRCVRFPSAGRDRRRLGRRAPLEAFSARPATPARRPDGT